MTISSMLRAGALVFVALLSLTACGDKEEVASAADLEAAQAQARDAMDAVERLEARIELLEEDLAGAADGTKKLSKDLDQAVGALRSSLKELRGSVGDAAAAAEAAAGDVATVARRITVLEERYDFHLKRYHGGG